MSNRTRSILKAIAVIVVLIAVLMELDIVAIRSVNPYSFWMVVISFGILLISSK